MPSGGLIVIAAVKPGCEEPLRTTLNRIGNDVNGKRLANGVREPHIDFPSSHTIHFARLALLPDADRGPDSKGVVDLLLSLLTDDVTWSMPPLPHWYRGRDSVAEFATTIAFTCGCRWPSASPSS